MGALATTFRSLFDGSGSMMMALLVFLAAGTLAFSLMAFVRVRGAVKKRASRMMWTRASASRTPRARCAIPASRRSPSSSNTPPSTTPTPTART